MAIAIAVAASRGHAEPPDLTESVGAGPVETASDEDGFADVVLVGDDAHYWCSGVVIDDRRVLTARHCAAATRVGLGHGLGGLVAVAVERRQLHPTLDVAVLGLATSVNVRVHPRRLAADVDPPVGTIRIVGFGVRDRLRLTGFGTRRRVDVAVDGWGCTVGRAAAVGCRLDDELVVRGAQGTDTCLGDSGGGVFELSDRGWRLLAITSRGMRPRKVICGEGGIYVRIDRIQPWLGR